MRDFLKNDMMAALRLTRQGRLKDAVALLRGPPPAPGAFAFAKPPLNDAFEALGRLKTAPVIEGMPGLGPKPAPEPPGGARFEAREFANAAGSRKYKLFVPASYNGEAMALVVMLHGCTQSPDDFAVGTRMNELAEAQGFFVAYPGQATSANVSKCWNWFNPADQQRGLGEPSIIAGITQQIMGEFSVLPRKVYIAGISAGGAMAAIMGAAYPEIYAAVGVHSGLASGAASDFASAMAAMRRGGTRHVESAGARPIPTIVFHGDKDATVNIANAAQVIAQAKGNAVLRSDVVEGQSAGGMKYTRTTQSTEDGRPVLEEWVLRGAGHAWSGGSAAGSFTLPAGPDASREMLRFFNLQ
jgi:poly(hydroxyalkanoate) depolymerase family esterase